MLVLDDLHWAEPPLLDLVEHVADWSREAPIFLLCVARPELLDVRPGWGGGKLNATSVLLEPLGDDGVGRARRRPARRASSSTPDVRDRILATAEGNPLFLEELASLAREARGPRRPAADDPGAAAGAPRHARRARAERDRAWRRGGQGVPPRRGDRARAGGAAGGRAGPAALARAQGARATRSHPDRRRRRLPLPPPADPRHGLRGAAEGHSRRAPRALRRLAGRARRAARAGRDRRLPPRAGRAVPSESSTRTTRARRSSRCSVPSGSATPGKAAFEREDHHATRNLLVARDRPAAPGATADVSSLILVALALAKRATRTACDDSARRARARRRPIDAARRPTCR